MIKSILFDMDGVLVDTDRLHCISYIETLKKFGINLTKEEYYDFWTRRGKGIIGFIKERNILHDPEKIREHKRKLYHTRLKKDPLIIDGVLDKLKEFSSKHTLALVSSSYMIDMGRIMEITGLRDFFKVIISLDDVTEPKPSSEGFLLAAEKLGVKPEECAVIENAESGVIAAKNAGMFCVAIPTNETKDNNFSRADVVIKSIKELNERIWQS